jgi:hypothetical protein
MKRHYLAISAAALAMSIAGGASASEFSDGVIVVSDNWCAPFNDGWCNNCNTNRLTRGVRCDGSYCDNMVYQCANPPIVNGVQTSMDGPRFLANSTDPSRNYGWTSDEQGSWSTNALCPVGYAMIGMYSNGSYADNIRASCQHVNRPGGWGGVTITMTRANTPISEEAPNNTFSTGNWISGAACTNSYCDNMYYWFNIISW